MPELSATKIVHDALQEIETLYLQWAVAPDTINPEQFRRDVGKANGLKTRIIETVAALETGQPPY